MFDKKRAIFLDRDGVLIHERGDYNYLPEDIKILENTVDFLLEFQQKGFYYIVITNQSGISKQVYSHDRVKEIHNDLFNFYKSKGIHITDFYYCPHHNTVTNCLCRKPKSVMIEKAAAKYNIDISSSYMIGDAERDILAAESIGVKAIKINSNDDLQTISHLII